MLRREDVRALIAQLDTLSLAELRVLWREHLRGRAPPCRSGEVLRFEIAWRLQVGLEGDLDRASQGRLKAEARALRAVEKRKPPPLFSVGTRFVREWRGEFHRVEVTAQGFLYTGEVFRSLTAVARRISGVHRSGVKFFQIEPEGVSR